MPIIKIGFSAVFESTPNSQIAAGVHNPAPVAIAPAHDAILKPFVNGVLILLAVLTLMAVVLLAVGEFWNVVHYVKTQIFG